MSWFFSFLIQPFRICLLARHFRILESQRDFSGHINSQGSSSKPRGDCKPLGRKLTHSFILQIFLVGLLFTRFLHQAQGTAWHSTTDSLGNQTLILELYLHQYTYSSPQSYDRCHLQVQQMWKLRPRELSNLKGYLSRVQIQTEAAHLQSLFFSLFLPSFLIWKLSNPQNLPVWSSEYQILITWHQLLKVCHVHFITLFLYKFLLDHLRVSCRHPNSSLNTSVCIVVIYCCVTNYPPPKHHDLIKQILIISQCGGQESGWSLLAGSSASGSITKLESRPKLGLYLCEVSLY